jgi:DNA-binding SARP family transcriptional activator
MKLHSLLQQSYDTFMTEAQESRLILLHPDSRLRSMLVAKLMNSAEFDTFYYAIGADDVDLQSFINGISSALAVQHVTFGRHINILPRYVLENPNAHFDKVLQAFVQDVSELSERSFLLILDEYDLSDRADEVQHFVERLSNSFPSNGRLVINSRTLPRLPWLAMLSQRRASLIKDNEVITQQFYGMPNRDRNQDGTLQVYSIGPSFVMVDGIFIDTWEGHLPRLLFFFALDRPIVTRSEICDAFWPELDAEQAVNVFHVTKRRLHKALEADVLVHDDGYYKVNPDLPVYYDALEYVNALMRSRRTDDVEAKMTDWARVIELYRGPFLQGHNELWITERRNEFRDGYIEAVTGTAAVWWQKGRLELALSLFNKAVKADVYREDIHRDIMRLYDEMNRRSEAASQYKNLVTLLKAKKKAINPTTETLYQQIINS